MQEIKKQPIVLASILKPVDDTRMLNKMGKSLSIKGQHQVHIIGYGDKIESAHAITHALGKFSRLSITRMMTPLTVLKKLIAIRPKTIIINTHELLLISILYKLIFRNYLIYDILENYALNVSYTNVFPKVLRPFIASWIRTKEWISKPFINQYILAERAYESELPFIGNKYTIIENKCLLPNWYLKSDDSEKIRLLFSGTIDTSTGIFESIALAKALYALDNRVELRIIGFCALPDIRTRILKTIEGFDFISIKGLHELVNHDEIIREISQAKAGLVFYPLQHTVNRTPTKVYEYLACQLPIIYDNSSSFIEIISSNDAGVAIDFNHPNHKEILNKLMTEQYYPSRVREVLWATEEAKFIKSIS